jgi:PBP1b-binding outer membrane lipoprotein LpoB
MKGILRASAVTLVAVSAIFLSGCSGNDKPEAGVEVAPAPPSATSPTTAKPGNAGATPDMTVYPAPSGVKTGTGK